jgi:uncharacterized protein
MLDKIKSAAMVIMMLTFAYAAVLYAHTYANQVEPGNYRTFQVTGEGKAETKSDIGRFNFSVLTEGSTELDELQEENTGKMNNSISFLKAEGIDEADIKTENYNVNPRYERTLCRYDEQRDKPCPPPEIVGYTINQTVYVKVRDLNKVSSLLSGVVEAGANSVSHLSFDVDNKKDIINEAKTKAIADAREKAQVMAEAGGFSVGKLISIFEEGGGFHPEPYLMRGMGREFAEDSSIQKLAPAIEPGSQENTIRITLTYEIN